MHGDLKKLEANVVAMTESNKQQRQSIGFRGNKESSGSPSPSGKYVAPRPPMDSLKQWELVECDQGLRVVEKRSAAANLPSKGVATKDASPMTGRKSLPTRVVAAFDASLEKKLKAFEDSKIVQPVTVPASASQRDPADDAAKIPINLEMILKQRKGSAAESTDMLERLEQQVKAIEMETIAARMRKAEIISDFEPKIPYKDLRYTEHEDLLRNVTDDETEG